MKHIILPFVIIMTLTACSNEASDEQNDIDTSLETATDTVTAEQNVFLIASFPELFFFYAKQDSTFSTDGFHTSVVGPLDTLAASAIDDKQLKPYYPYLIFSSDSSQAIDLYSYNYVLVKKEGKTVAASGGPDTEIALVDLVNKTRRRIFFGGPSIVIYDARWLNDSTILLAGSEVVGDKKGIPVFWRMDLNQNQREAFYYTDTLRLDSDAWIDKRLNPKQI
jgi:hypothetical protein